MNWPMISTIATIVAALLGAWNTYIFARLKSYISDCREHDKKEIREWINGSFMRAAVVDEKVSALKTQVNDVKDRIEGMSRKHDSLESRLIDLAREVSARAH